MSNKNKNLLLDFKYLENLNITPYHILDLWAISIGHSLPIDCLVELENLDLIKRGQDKVVLRSKGIEILKDLTVHLNIKTANDCVSNKKPIRSSKAVIEDVDNHIVEYRDLWRGLKVGSMGDPKACRTNLINWLKDNPDYDMKDVLKASKVYLGSLDDLRYLQRADYFIYKQDKHKVKTSRLSAFIDEEFIDPDWTNALI